MAAQTGGQREEPGNGRQGSDKDRNDAPPGRVDRSVSDGQRVRIINTQS